MLWLKIGLTTSGVKVITRHFTLLRIQMRKRVVCHRTSRNPNNVYAIKQRTSWLAK